MVCCRVCRSDSHWQSENGERRVKFDAKSYGVDTRGKKIEKTKNQSANKKWIMNTHVNYYVDRNINNRKTYIRRCLPAVRCDEPVQVGLLNTPGEPHQIDPHSQLFRHHTAFASLALARTHNHTNHVRDETVFLKRLF